MTTLVTGATGTTGSRVAALLDEAGADVRRVSRSSPVRFDWYDGATHDAAFAGVDRLYLVAPLATGDPAEVVAPVLERAVSRGLRRVVLLSSSAVERSTSGIGRLHDVVVRTVAEPAVLRPAWFTQNFVGDHPTAQGLRGGELVTAAGDGRVPFVDAGDIAAVAATCLLSDAAPEEELRVTGPEALTYADVCALYAGITGRPARHRHIGTDELAARLAGFGMPAGFAAFQAGLDAVIASGSLATVTDAVERVTGRPPRTVRAVLTEAYAAETVPAPAAG